MCCTATVAHFSWTPILSSFSTTDARTNQIIALGVLPWIRAGLIQPTERSGTVTHKHNPTVTAFPPTKQPVTYATSGAKGLSCVCGCSEYLVGSGSLHVLLHVSQRSMTESQWLFSAKRQLRAMHCMRSAKHAHNVHTQRTKYSCCA